MLNDSQGLPVTTDSLVAIAAINRFVDEALGYGKEAEQVLIQGNVADRECALIHAYTAAYYLSQESAAFRRRASLHIQAAQRHSRDVTCREWLYIAAIVAWAEGAIEQAISLHEQIAEEYPTDLVSVQQGQYHYFYQGRFKELVQIGEKVMPAHDQNHYLYGMVAFGLEQCDRLAEAEAIGRQAVALNRSDAWAQHAVAHVLETQGRVEEGIEWLESLADTWETCNSMLYTHNWWHLALYYLRLGDFNQVLSLYDDRVWGRANKNSPKDQVGAIATLLRLDLQGVETGSRWQELSPYLQPRIHEHALPFQDLHYVYALARAGQTTVATEMVRSMQEYARTVSTPQRSIWANIAIPVAQGLIAYAKGDCLGAVRTLESHLSNLQMLGGSHTQRALFQEIYTNAFYHCQRKPSLTAIASQATSQKSRDRHHLTVLSTTSSTQKTPLPSLRPGTKTKSARSWEAYRMILMKGGHLGC